MHLRTVDAPVGSLGLALVCCLLLFTGCGAVSSADEPGFVSSLVRRLVVLAINNGPADASGTGREESAAVDPIATRPPALPDATPTSAAASETADDPEEGFCPPTYRGVVTVVALRDAQGLGRAVADRGKVPVVYRTTDTVVYEDGQVLTTKLEDVTAPLSELGWSSNPIRLLGSAASSSVRSGSGSWSWNGARADGTFKPQRTKRRG